MPVTNVLNFGSLNIDRVFHVPHFVRPGETLATRSVDVFAGGKGANQSVALARAGARVHHAGRVGPDGVWLKKLLKDNGVDVERVVEGTGASGQAIIQISREGENAILLFGGENHAVTAEQIDNALSAFGENDVLLLQNEVCHTAEIIRRAHARGMLVCFNPAPFGPETFSYPLELVSLLIVNETEARGLAAAGPNVADEQVAKSLRQKYPNCDILMTRGGKGSLLVGKQGLVSCPARMVKAVDTTSAGDTFIGYFLALRLEGQTDEFCLKGATAAASLCVSRPGAIPSIPRRAEVDALLADK